MALAGFYGAAAQTTDNSMREWRKLFQVDQQLKQERERTEKEFDYREREFEWRTEMADIQNALANDTFQMDRLENFYEKAMGRWDTMDTGERFALMSSMDAMDFSSAGPMVGQFANSYKAVMEANLRDTMTAPQARQYLAQVLNSDYGTHVPQFLLTEAYRALEGHEDYDDIRSMMDEYSATTEEDRADFLANERVVNFMAARQAEADVGETEARTGLLGSQTTHTETVIQGLIQDIGFEAEKHPLVVRNLDLVNQTLENDIRTGQISNEYLGPQLAANLSHLLAETRELDNANEIHEAIFSSLVDRYVAETDMTRSDARVMLATEMSRIALADLAVNRETATTAQIEATTDQIRKTIEVLDSELDINASVVDNNRLANVEARVRIAQDLVATGNPELLAATGRELLAPVVGEDQVDALLGELSEIATSTREMDDKVELANYRITLFEGDFLERTMDDRATIVEQQAIGAGLENDATAWQNSVNQRQLEFYEWATKEGFRINEDQFNRELNWRMSQPAAGTAGMIGVSWDDAMKTTNDVTRTNPQNIREQWGAFQTTNADYQEVLRLREPTTGGFDRQLATGVLVRHGVIDDVQAMGLTEDQLFQLAGTLESRLAAEVEVARNQAIGGARQYVNVLAGMGHMLTQEQMGWPTDLWSSAYANYGTIDPGAGSSVSTPAEDVFLFDAETGGELQGPSLPAAPPTTEIGLLSQIERSAIDTYYDPESGFSFLKAKEVWDNELSDDMKTYLSAEYDVLSAHDFATYLDDLGSRKQGLIMNVGDANYYYRAAGNTSVDPSDGSSRVAFQNFATNLTTNAPRALELLNQTHPSGLSQEEVDWRAGMGAELPEGALGHDTAAQQIAGMLGIPIQLFFERGAVRERNGRVEIHEPTMRAMIRDMSNTMATAYNSVDILARW